MQRAQRNVPVYLREQQQAEEKAQEKLLLLKEQQRDKQYMDKEQVCVCVCVCVCVFPQTNVLSPFALCIVTTTYEMCSNSYTVQPIWIQILSN